MYPIHINFLAGGFPSEVFCPLVGGSIFVLEKKGKVVKAHFEQAKQLFENDNEQTFIAHCMADEAYEKFKDAIYKKIPQKDFNAFYAIKRYDIPRVMLIAPLLYLLPKKAFNYILKLNFGKRLNFEFDLNHITQSPMDYIYDYSDLKKSHQELQAIENSDHSINQAINKGDISKNMEFNPIETSKIRDMLKDYLKEEPLHPPSNPKLKL